MPSPEIKWENDGLIYNGGYVTTKIFKPSEEEWSHFWRVTDEIKLWLWSEEYDAPVLDGIQWSLEIQVNNKRIKSYGSNAYPDPDDISKAVAIEKSKPFERFLSAVRELTDETCFSFY